MNDCLCAELLCSAGLRFTSGNSTILVDALNGTIMSFPRIPAPTLQKVVEKKAPFEHVDGIFYTHLHPDHYDQEVNRRFLETHPGIPSFFPTAETPDRGLIQAGAFSVEYGYLEHTPCEYAWAKHYVLLITAGKVQVYLAGDAELSPEKHLAFLDGRKVDYGFWNAMYLSYPETRALMTQAAKKAYIYHMPEPATDASGICRKAAHNMERYPSELQTVEVLTAYPCTLQLPPR